MTEKNSKYLPMDVIVDSVKYNEVTYRLFNDGPPVGTVPFVDRYGSFRCRAETAWLSTVGRRWENGQQSIIDWWLIFRKTTTTRPSSPSSNLLQNIDFCRCLIDIGGLFVVVKATM